MMIYFDRPHSVMKHEILLFALIAVGCYLIAFLTSHAFATWFLTKQVAAELGNKARYVAIDGVRGHLAFGVYVHHCIVTWTYLCAGYWGAPLHNFENQLGKTSVAIFFMITAFLFWGRAYTKKGIDWKKFFITRLFRIYPLYIFIVILICLAVGYRTDWVAHQSLTRVAREIAGWLVFRMPEINGYETTPLVVAGVTWTLLYEAWFYLSLPLLAVIVLQKNAIWRKVTAFILVAVLFVWNHLDFAIAATFFGGFVAVYWRSRSERLRLFEGKAASFVALVCLACEMFFLYEPFNPVGILLLTVFFVIISSGNTLFGLLELRASLWMGEISYSIYLCHGFILWLIMQNILPRSGVFHQTSTWFIGSAIGLAPLVILFSSATHLIIERPLIALGHRIASRRSKQVIA